MGWRLVALAALVVGASACTAAGGESASSEAGSSNVFVRGRVLADGEPVSGVRVRVRLERPGAVEGRRYADYLDPGAYDVSAETDHDGGYVVEIDPHDVGDDYFTDARSVTFGVGVTARGRSMGWGGTAWLVDEEGTWRTEKQADSGDRVLEVVIDVGRGQARVTSSSGKTETHGLGWVGAVPPS